MKKLEKKWYVFMVMCSIIALLIMVAYNYSVFKSNLRDSVDKAGNSALTYNLEQLEEYLFRRMDVVKTTASSVEYMMVNGASPEEIENFLVYESERYTEEIDENFTGIYGVINGEYVDGAGWVPDADYQPTERGWYKDAISVKGELAIISPYVDAKTGDVMISFSKMLLDGESVISLDIKLDYIQYIVENANINGMGYAFATDENGMVVAHKDKTQRGKTYIDDDSYMYDIMQKVLTTENEIFKADIDGETYTVFTDSIMDSWRLVLVVDDDELFKEAKGILGKNIIVSVVICIFVISFFLLAFSKTNQSIALEKESNKKVEEMNRRIIRSLVKTIDAKDRYTNGHSIRVAEYSREIAKRMNKSPKDQESIYYAGLLHDVGKIRIPMRVINKAGKLTDEEYEQIKIHPVTSYHILKDIFDDVGVKNGAKFHHERYDGKGYPNGLKGENIPEIARIIGVADAYDAMASNRSYRKSLPQNVIREEIEKGKGTQFDPKIADIMLQMIDEDKNYAMKETESHQKKILVIDDEPINIKVISVILADSPMYEVIGARSGKEGLEILEKENIDMILLDVMMPEMDGFETISRIREKYDMPIVMMTGDRNIETIERATKYGVDDYLTKPFMPLPLMEIIHSTLN